MAPRSRGRIGTLDEPIDLTEEVFVFKVESDHEDGDSLLPQRPQAATGHDQQLSIGTNGRAPYLQPTDASLRGLPSGIPSAPTITFVQEHPEGGPQSQVLVNERATNKHHRKKQKVAKHSQDASANAAFDGEQVTQTMMTTADGHGQVMLREELLEHDQQVGHQDGTISTMTEQPDGAVHSDNSPASDAQLQTPIMTRAVKSKTGPTNITARSQEHVNNLPLPAAVQSPGPGQALTYPNLAAVQTALASTSSAWTPPQPDNTIPTTDAERQVWATRVKAAFESNETLQGKRGYKLWLTKQKLTDVYSTEAIEHTSYRLVHIAETLHTQGPSSLRIWKPEMLAEIKKTSQYTFAERMEHVLKLICFWKTRCEDMMQASGFEEIVGMPFKKMTDAVGNADMNRLRQVTIEKGRGKKQVAGPGGGTSGAVEGEGEAGVQPDGKANNLAGPETAPKHDKSKAATSQASPPQAEHVSATSAEDYVTIQPPAESNIAPHIPPPIHPQPDNTNASAASEEPQSTTPDYTPPHTLDVGFGVYPRAQTDALARAYARYKAVHPDPPTLLRRQPLPLPPPPSPSGRLRSVGVGVGANTRPSRKHPLEAPLPTSTSADTSADADADADTNRAQAQERERGRGREKKRRSLW